MATKYKMENGQRVLMTDAEEADLIVSSPTISALELALINLRSKRNFLLAETDFYALSDVTMSSEMQTYRQDLRDLTNGLTTVEQVEAVTWPIKPGA
jgi:hypothetical protein|tara:strand:- start:30 stop:320 length:291 start_codon:yes stop_codon:yes gene_type:complete